VYNLSGSRPTVFLPSDRSRITVGARLSRLSDVGGDDGEVVPPEEPVALEEVGCVEPAAAFIARSMASPMA
jgi:hypothetical protein